MDQVVVFLDLADAGPLDAYIGASLSNLPCDPGELVNVQAEVSSAIGTDSGFAARLSALADRAVQLRDFVSDLRGAAGTIGLVLSLISIGFFAPTIPWAFDSLTGWRMELPVDTPAHRITLVQRPRSDFYNSTFRVERAEDSLSAFVSYDVDDSRWWLGRTEHRDGRLYFRRGWSEIDERTSYIDPDAGILYSGYHQTTHDLASLAYRHR